MKCSIKWFVFVALISMTAFGENRLRVYELKHSFAAPVLDIIRPHLSPGASASAHDNKLLLNISDEEFARLEPILQQLDKAPIRVMVSVRQAKRDNHQEQNTHADVTVSNQGVDANVSARYQTNREHENALQRVQTMSGQAAFLQTGYDIPYLTMTMSPVTGVVQAGTQFRAIGTGFYVLPRVNQNTVTVIINPRQQTLSGNGQIRSQVAETQVQGQVGEWIALGGTTQTAQSYQTNYRQSWQLELKVDVLP